MAQAPAVDRRDFEQLVLDTQAALRRALGLPDGAEPPSGGLVPIFARLAEIVVARINAAPDKNLLAFLSLVGVVREPPQPARVPLTFHLAQGAVRARVPAGTAAAATPAAGETAAPVYETESELVLTATQPAAAFVREPDRDLYADVTAVVAGSPDALPVFAGGLPIPHELYLGDALLSLPQAKDVTIRLGPLDPDHEWPAAVSWWRYAGGSWQPAAPTLAADTGGGVWTVSFSALPAVEPATVGGVAGTWLRARLETPLPPPGPDAAPDTVAQAALPFDAAFADTRALDPEATLFPFGDAVPRNAFYVACERAFSKPGAAVSIAVDVDTERAATPSASLALEWSYWNGDGWIAVGSSSPDAGGGSGSFADGTRAFTRDGAVAFTAPSDWTASELGDVTARWLRVAVAAGDFGSPPAYAAPVLLSATVSYSWPLPRLETLTREVAIERSGLQPDAALFGVTPLDLTKDFRPFGDKPRFNDVFYLAHDEALSLPGARVTLHVTGTKAVSAADTPTLTWEVYDGASGLWQQARVESDTTGAFTFSQGLAGVVVLRAPAAPAPVALAGQERHWLRARLTGGDYGKEADFTIATKDGTTTVTPVKATWDPPSIASVTLDYSFADGPDAPGAAATVNDFVVETPSGSFLPFTVTADERPTFYLGAATPFDNDATTLFFELPDVTYGGGSRTPPEPAVVVWEYRSADGWQPLGTRDETRNFAGRGLLTFVGPADAEPSAELGVSAYWLRARWERGGWFAPPRLARVLTNTIWATHAQTVRGEVLGSSTGEERQRFTTARLPVLPGQQVEVRELGPPSAPELAALAAEEGPDAVSVEDGETWVRWHEVVDFYGSGPRSRHYALDRLTGEIRFGDGRRGLAPPQGRGNVRAALYRTGGGAVGNRPAGSIVQLKTAVPYVDKVTNHQPAAGGADVEPLEAVRERGPRQLRHGNRAVTIADVEDLAREASPGIARVLGIPAADPSDAGRVGVVVVPASDERRPVPSVELLDRVRARLEERMPPIVDLWVAGPGWLRIAVTAEVVPVTLEQAADVQSAVRAALEAFLHPLTGGPHADGWPFGRRPRRSDLLALIERLPGVDHVRGLSVEQTETEPPPAPSAVLVYSAEHTITAAGSTEETAE